CGVADIRSESVIEQIQRTGAPRYRRLAGRLAGGISEVGIADLHPILAQTKGEAPAAKVDQVLYINASLAQRPIMQRVAGIDQSRVAVDRIKGIQGRCGTVTPIH